MYYFNCRCICNLLFKLERDTFIKIYFFGGGETIIKFIRLRTDCIEGLTIDDTHIYIDCGNIVGFSIYPRIPPDWEPIAAGESYPLPDECPIIGVIGFEGRTQPGRTSTITLFYMGVPIESATIAETPLSVVWNLGDGYLLSDLTFTNTGGSTVYINNLTTELPPNWLKPGDDYPIQAIEPGRVIDRINVTWEDKGTGATGSLYLDNVLIDTINVPDTLDTSSWNDLHHLTTDTTEIRIEINNGYACVESSEVIYESGCKVLAYVTNQDSGNVSVIDTADLTVIDTITAGSRPSGAAITPNGRLVYVGNWFYDVSVIDTLLKTVIATIPGVNAFGAAVTPDGNYAYITNLGGSCTVSVVDTSTNTIVSNVNVGGCFAGGGAYNLAVTPDGAYVYLAAWWGNSVSVIAASTNTLDTIISVGNRPMGIAITPDGVYAYVAIENDNQVKVIDIATNTVVHTVDIGNSPFGIAITPDGTRAYVTIQDIDQVQVIDIATNMVIHTISVGNSPFGIAITPDGTQAYVANILDNTVSVINLDTNTVVATINVGDHPYAIAIGTVCTV